MALLLLLFLIIPLLPLYGGGAITFSIGLTGRFFFTHMNISITFNISYRCRYHIISLDVGDVHLWRNIVLFHNYKTHPQTPPVMEGSG